MSSSNELKGNLMLLLYVHEKHGDRIAGAWSKGNVLEAGLRFCEVWRY
jgi:hypothetical protein